MGRNLKTPLLLHDISTIYFLKMQRRNKCLSCENVEIAFFILEEGGEITAVCLSYMIAQNDTMVNCMPLKILKIQDVKE